MAEQLFNVYINGQGKLTFLKKKYIVIPLNYSLHWSLIVICHPGEVTCFRDKEIKESSKVSCILHMDSLKGHHKGLENVIQSYLCEEQKELVKLVDVKLGQDYEFVVTTYVGLYRYRIGDNPEVAFLLRRLLIASSSLLRLNLQMDDSSLPSSCVPAFIENSQVLLLEFTEMVGVPQQPTFLLLDGALRYLRELASHFPFTDPTSSSKVYTKLVQIHMRVIGKSILLQGKRAKLTLHEIQSSTKTLHKGPFEAFSSNEMHYFCLNELKTRLHVSLKAFIEGQSELHLLSTIQAIERALVGVQEGRTIIYGIKTNKDGGEISTLVAAGIDCLDMILEFVSSRKGLKLIKRHCQSLVSVVFNIIVHLQSPRIFYVNLRCKIVSGTPDPGSAILMFVEVLTTVSRKHGLFSIDVCHVGHMLHIPVALFQNFHQHRISKASRPSDSFMVLEEQNPHSEDGVNFCHVDHQFTINLFVACCQLLCTIIRHRPSECKQCVAHLEASVTVLLNCLEIVLENNRSTVNEGWFCWEVEEEVEINIVAIIPDFM